MSYNHDNELDARLKAIAQGATPGPSIADDVMRLIEQGEPQSSRAGTAGPQGGDDSTTSPKATPPSVRLVPDVPTELADGVPRETHSIEQPPDRRHAQRRFVVMLHSKAVRWSAVAAVAAAVVLVIGFWPDKDGRGPGSAFATAIEHFQKAKTIVCRITTTTPVPGTTRTAEQSGRLYFSAEYGSRCEMLMNGIPMLIQYTPLQGPTTSVTPLSRTFTVMDTHALDQDASRGSSPDAFILALAKLKGEASRELGRKNLDGVEALGYEISGQILGLGHAEGVRSELWINATTYLPVRYLADIPVPQLGGTMRMVYDQFEWDTPVDAKLIVPEIPADYTRLDAKAPVADEAALIKGLGNYAELVGKYPPALDATTITTDYSAALGRRIASEMMRTWKAPDQKELMQKSLEIGSGIEFYQKLIREGRSPEYFGKTVTPGQKEGVLVRWKTEDGQLRVIYGDLRVETLPGQ